MAATRISPAQRQFAGQVAWERDVKIVNWPTTPQGLSALIQRMIRELAPVAIADWQVDAINERLERAAVEIDGFEAGALFADHGLAEGEMPTDRTTANKMLKVLNEQLGQAEFSSVGTGSLESFVAARGSEEAKRASAEKTAVEDDSDLSF
jgi:uncharacterized protein (DUF1786 family)